MLSSIWLSRRWAAHMSFGLGGDFDLFSVLFFLFLFDFWRRCFVYIRCESTQIGSLLSRSLPFVCLGVRARQARHINYSFRFLCWQTACCQMGNRWWVEGRRGLLANPFGEQANRACPALLVIYKHARHFR